MLKYSMNEVTSIGWPFDRDVEYYSRVGIPAIGLHREKLEAYGADKGLRLVKDSGLAVACMLSAGGFPLSDRSQWPAKLEETNRAIEHAARAGAGCLMLQAGPPGALSYEEAEPRFLEVLSKVLPEAASHGVRLAVEPNHSLQIELGYMHTMHDALDLADKVDSLFFTVVCEVNNAWIERRLYENIRTRTRRIGLVQLNDFKAGTKSTPHRVPMGEGVIPLERIIRAFHDAGYEGYYDVEVLGPDVEALGYEETIRRCLDYICRLPY